MAEFVRIPQVARYLDLSERLDGDPIAHRMGEDVDPIGVARQSETKDVLETVARRRGAVGVVDIIHELPARRPGEQHRNAISLRSLERSG